MTLSQFGEHWANAQGVRVVTYHFVNTRPMHPEAAATITEEGVYHTNLNGQTRWLDQVGKMKRKLLLLSLVPFPFPFRSWRAFPFPIPRPP